VVVRSIAKIVVLCLALVLAVSIGVVPAAASAKKGHAAKKPRVGAEAVLDSVGPDGIAGRVSSPNGSCRAQRHVTVYRVNTGASIPSGEFVAATWTRSDGTWSVPGPMYPSQFYAVVDSKNAKRVVCESATSNSRVWG
jgi:hypothetical protein